MYHISKYLYIIGLVLIFGINLPNLQITEEAIITSTTFFSHIGNYQFDLNDNCIQTSWEDANEINADSIFNSDPKAEPEKGLILIGLGMVIIFIILGVLHYYKKKREKEDNQRTSEMAKLRTKNIENSEKSIPKTGRKHEKESSRHYPASYAERTKAGLPSKELEKARKKMMRGDSFSRKKALKLFHEAVEKEPANFVYNVEAIIPCLEDKDNSVKKETLRLIEKAGVMYSDEFIDSIDDIVNLLVHDDKGIRKAVRGALTVLGMESDEAEKGILRSIDNKYKILMEKGSLREGFLPYCLSLNKFLVKLGKNRNESIPEIMNILLRCITYPIYRPEQSEDKEEELYRDSGNSICILSEYAPGSIPLVLPKILKVLSDTYTFENWNKDAEAKESLRNVYQDNFIRLTSGDPKYFIISLLKSASSTNSTMVRLVHERVLGMADEDFVSVVHSVIGAFDSGDENIRNNAEDMVERIAPIDLTSSSEILMKYISGENERTARYSVRVLKNLLESTELAPLNDLNPILKIMDSHSNELRREAVALLGRIIERDKSQANQCMKFIVKALKQEWGVRLEALSSLSLISKGDPILRKFSIPFIIEGLQDKHEQVRWRASNILKELDIYEKDIKHYESARRQMDLAEPKLAELHKGTALDLNEIVDELSKAKEMIRSTNYRQADLHATRTNEMLIDLQARNKPEVDMVMKEKTKFIVGIHTPFKLILLNTGMVHIFDISIEFSENVEIIEEAPVYVKAGGEQDMSLAWTPLRGGRIPLKVTCSFKEKNGAVRGFNKDIWVDVRAEDFIEEDASVTVGVLWDMLLI